MTKLERFKVVGWVFLINLGLPIIFSRVSKLSPQLGVSPSEGNAFAFFVAGLFGAILYGLLIFWPRIDPRSDAILNPESVPPKPPPTFSLDVQGRQNPAPLIETDIAPGVLSNIHQRVRLVIASVILQCFLAIMYQLLFIAIFDPKHRTFTEELDYNHQEAHSQAVAALIVYPVGIALFLGLVLCEQKVSRFLLDFVRWVFFSRRSERR